MARKTNGSTTTTRGKKTETSVPLTPVQVAVEAEVPKNGKPVNLAPANAHGSVAVNLEEEIRRRAYELYLQRRATAGGETGNPNQDWLIAEREIRLRFEAQERRSA